VGCAEWGGKGRRLGEALIEAQRRFLIQKRGGEKLAAEDDEARYDGKGQRTALKPRSHEIHRHAVTLPREKGKGGKKCHEKDEKKGRSKKQARCENTKILRCTLQMEGTATAAVCR